MRLILIAGLCLAAAACSRSDQAKVQQDTQAAGHDLSNAAQDVKNDPTIKQAGVEAKEAAHDTAVALRKGAAVAEVKAGQAMVDAGDKTKRAAANAQDDSGNRSQN